MTELLKELAEVLPKEWELLILLRKGVLTVPTGQFNRWYPEPVEYQHCAMINGASDRESALAIILLLDDMESRGWQPTLDCSLTDDRGKYQCHAIGESNQRIMGQGATRTEAVIRAYIQSRKENTNE